MRKRRNELLRSATSIPHAARLFFTAELKSWEGRIAMGDPLFDQWMVDAMDAAKRGLAIMDEFEGFEYDTGKAETDVQIAKWDLQNARRRAAKN